MLPVAILAGGLATRMRPLTETIPKALLNVANEPFIFHQLRLLRRIEIQDVVLCVGYLGEQIKAVVGDGSSFGMNVTYSSDWPELRGTGGALKKALPLLGEHFMVLYGDSYLDIPYTEVTETFIRSGQPALMTVYRNANQHDTSNVIYRNGRIEVYDKRHYIPEMDYIDYGLGCLSASLFLAQPNSFDLADIYSALATQGKLVGYEVHSRFYEIGSPAGLCELNLLLA